MTEADISRHEWQCNQGRGDSRDDDLNAARGILWCTIGCLAFWAGVITWVLW